MISTNSSIEVKAISLVSKLSPWLSTFPTAWAISLAIVRQLGWPAWVAAIVGVSVETLGVASAATALELWSYQRSKRKLDPGAPVWLGIVMVLLYFAGVVLLSVVLDNNPMLAVFPILSLVAVGNLALRSDHASRLNKIASEREEMRALREQRRKLAPQSSQPAPQKLTELLYTCDSCERKFAKQTSLAAHKRYCKAKTPEPEMEY